MARVSAKIIFTCSSRNALIWECSLGDIVNSWRASHDLTPVPFSEGPFLPDLLKIPTTYCWSPA